MDKIRCVIFDCEGTLVDSEVLCCQAIVDVFAHFNKNISLEDCLNHFQGGKPADILAETCHRLNCNLSLDLLEPLYRDRKQVLYEAQLKPIKGANYLLSQLQQLGIGVCIASNSESDKIKHALRLTGLNSYFRNAIYSAFDANSWKPEPDLLLYTALNMGVSPKECIYVDDTLKGVEAGIRAGMTTYYYRPNQPEYQVDHEAVHTISNIEEILFNFEQKASELKLNFSAS
ncbi:putative 2-DEOXYGLUCOSE-6-PHOSPHATE PHOSPHATASE 2 [Vibrio nigripulchritudo SOn1]|uniref:2-DEOXYGLUCOSE-6-PHOSPHATE PHOSPHATASE 2 n=1 Tax=Vibrio nigripulchritudo SOn1 TaxID=1238450 RepID=A0AAV2VN53_9VIBR|nr:HAD-IA family hydrolase [Vibrio nigripulchritudo]CCO46067.1 putative 2-DEOXYGLUCOSE-6-PHOSPHATE PHOSPHATASE 2 [Vibrio nigripulchritudo SOn1]